MFDTKERRIKHLKSAALHLFCRLCGAVVPFLGARYLDFWLDLASEVQFVSGGGRDGEVCMNGTRSRNERRKWARLPLAIPVFVRSRDGKGKEFLEFATSLNVSAGGMLVAIRRTLPAVAQIRLEIPSAPVAAMALLPRAARTLNAKTLRTTPADGYYLLGLKFVRPLPLSKKPKVRRRKLLSKL
jgi:hypothetical protein